MMKITILLLALLSGIYSVVLEIVRYRSASNPTPANVADVYDAETYGTWKRYSAEHCRLGIASAAVSCALSLVLLCTDAYAAFASLLPTKISWQIMSVILLETAVGAVLDTVRSYISTMVIEQKYGFNRSTMKTFIFDRIRSTLLGLGLAMFLTGLLIVFYTWLGYWMIVLFAGAVFAFTLVISFLYPIFSRVGNKFTPLEDGELKDRLMDLLNSHGYKVKAIEVMDASRRTTKLNAYFTGFGKMKTIVLFDNLLNAMSTDEICAVFAHELGHGLHKDVLKRQIMNFGNLLLMAVVAYATVQSPALHTAFGFAEVNYGFSYVLMGILLGLVQPFTGMLMHAYSRKAEYRADRQAVKEGYGAAMTSALKKLARDNFVHLSPSPVNVVLEYSHPPLSRRIEEVEKAMKE
jgi:STE24 endopeptidase